MSFQLSSDINQNKTFLVNLTECRVRLDPYYYKPEFLALRKRLENHQLFQKMGSLIKSWNRGDGPREGFYTDDAENGVFFLRVNNLKNHTIDINEIKYITRYVHENTLKRAKVSAGDVVFAISGTKDNLGTVSVIPESILEANLNSALVKLELNWSVIDKKYFCYMFDLNITRTQIDFIGKGAAQNNLNNEEISQIYLFLPPINQQKKIVWHLDEAHTKKEKKEAEAQRLLGSIDDYLLSELGINLPKSEENTLQNRIFYNDFSEVSGDRFDASFYKPIYTLLTSNIRRLPHNKLGRIAHFSTETWDQESLFDEFFPYIEIGEIDPAFGEIKSISDVRIEDAPSRARMIVRSGDILVSTTRPNRGAIVEIEEREEILIASTGFSIIRTILREDLNKKFLFYVMRHSISLKQMEKRSSGGNYPAITQEELRNIFIPIPSLEKQLEIVDHITAIRNQSKQLRKEAGAELEQAKQEVEAMILGG